MLRHPDSRLVVAAAVCMLVSTGIAHSAAAQESAADPPATSEEDVADSPEEGSDDASEAAPSEEAPDEAEASDADPGEADPGASPAEADSGDSTSEADPGEGDAASTGAAAGDGDPGDAADSADPDGTSDTADSDTADSDTGDVEPAPTSGDTDAGSEGDSEVAETEAEPADVGTPADPTAPPGPPVGPPPEGTGDVITERRARPDLDGLPEPGISTEDALLWIPRIITGPLYLVTEFVIRRPLAWLVTELEQTDLLGLAQEIFTFADNKIGLFPTAFFDFGFVPSFGLYFFWDEFIFEENRLSANAGTFGPEWLSLVVNDRIKFSDTVELSARFEALRRPDQIFGGIGSQASTDIARFGISQIDAALRFQARVWQRSQIRAEVGYRSASFDNRGFLGNPSVGEAAVAQGSSLPDAFITGYSSIRAGADVRLDTRNFEGRPSAGVAVRAHGAAHGSVEGPPGFNGWFRWGGMLGGYTDILGDDRILGLEAETGFISAVDDATVPFNELFDVGATGPLYGFLPGMIRGRSVFALTAAYEWPVWVFLNGRLHFSVGNAFGEHFEDIDFEDMRMSFGFGLEPTLGGELPFEITFAFGTESFANGADITSVRFFLGARNGL